MRPRRQRPACETHVGLVRTEVKNRKWFQAVYQASDYSLNHQRDRERGPEVRGLWSCSWSGMDMEHELVKHEASHTHSHNTHNNTHCVTENAVLMAIRPTIQWGVKNLGLFFL